MWLIMFYISTYIFIFTFKCNAPFLSFVLSEPFSILGALFHTTESAIVILILPFSQIYLGKLLSVCFKAEVITPLPCKEVRLHLVMLLQQ
jgi:hypothetical protein